MNKEIFAYRLSDGKRTSETVYTASSCPKCGVTLSPYVLYASLVENPEDECDNKIFALNFCNNCQECFISRHIFWRLFI